jgi:hypothetical protein
MWKRLAFVLLIAFCLGSIAVSRSSAEGTPQAVGVIEGVGIDGIRIYQSTKDDVAAVYGKGFELVGHNKYSYEMIYGKTGLSFYFCYNDPEEKIFEVQIAPPHKAMTTKGIVVGESTLQDVFALYGKVDLSPTAESGIKAAEYDGVQFFVEVGEDLEDTEDKSKVENYLSRKISWMSIVPPGVSSNFCDKFDPKR